MIRLLSCLIAALLCACSPSPEDTGPEALEAALSGTRTLETRHGAGAQPPPLANAGPHRSSIRLSLTLDGDEPGYRRISIDREISRGAGGAFRIQDRRRWSEPALPVDGYDDGRDILYDGARLFIRRVGGPWAEREAMGGHPERLLSDAYAMSRSIQRAFGHRLSWVPAENAPAGLQAANVSWYKARLNLRGELAESPTGALETDRDHDTHWARWWGATHEVEEIEGSMARLEGSDDWIAGNLVLRGQAKVDGVSQAFTLRYSASVEPSVRPKAFDIPESYAPATRPRTWTMIEDVLGDELAPVYRK